MYFLGLDIGTTTVSAVVSDERGKVVDAKTCAHHAVLPGNDGLERQEDAEKLLSVAIEFAEQFCAAYEISGIGITGQQHGIVYLDESGNILSPLYTWQDLRATKPYKDGLSYVDYLRARTKHPIFAGYGLATHFYNVKNGLVPARTKKFCTVHDLLAMRLSGLKAPYTEPSDAQSLGFFDCRAGDFDFSELSAVGIDASLLPAVSKGKMIGKTEKEIPVVLAIGDNQASFIGATAGETDCALVNVGTGSQISVHTDAYAEVSGLETRPFPLGGYILVGSSLCGGRAWATLQGFFSECVKLFTGSDVNCYGIMTDAASSVSSGTLYVDTAFDGTRSNPEKRGKIENIGCGNLTVAELSYGVLRGMAEELYALYRGYLEETGEKPRYLFGSGNCLRLTGPLRKITEELFGMPLTMSENKEEAALGASVFAKNILFPERVG